MDKAQSSILDRIEAFKNKHTDNLAKQPALKALLVVLHEQSEGKNNNEAYATALIRAIKALEEVKKFW